MNSRLYKVRKVLKMSQVEFGREIGVSGAAISRIEKKGERGLTEQMLKSVCREYHVRREWLTEGRERCSDGIKATCWSGSMPC